VPLLDDLTHIQDRLQRARWQDAAAEWGHHDPGLRDDQPYRSQAVAG